MKNILFTICARAGSKGVSGKNIKKLNEIPLLCYTLAAYCLFEKEYKQQYGSIALALNTDSDILEEQMKKSNISYIFVQRTEELAGDFISKISVIRDTLIKAEEITKAQYDLVVDLDLTSPIRIARDIEGTIKTVLEDAEADISFSVTGARRSPYFNMVSLKENGYFEKVIQAEYVSRQQPPICFDMNASIYAYKKEYLLANRDNVRKALIWEMDDTAVLDIDEEGDFELLEIIMPYWRRRKREFDNIVHIAKDIARRGE